MTTSTAPELTSATYYEIMGQSIPARLTIRQRETFCRGLGVPVHASAVMALQDRGSSLGNQLGALIQESGDAQLIARAQRVIERWNQECEEFFQAHRR